jgi:predicted RNase H-like nuclease
MTALAGVGFQLAVHGKAVPGRQVIEVYPHIAVMRLLGEDYRVPYKIGRARRYWKERSREECRKLIHEYLGQILGALREHIQEIDLQLPPATARQADLKRFEDALDGVVCAWVGTLHLSGETESFGDQTAAIWVPRDRRLQPTAGKSEFGQTLSGTT